MRPRTLVRNMTAHHTLLVASGVAFTCVFGLIPAMIAVVSVYGLVAEPSDVESNLRPLVDALPEDAGNLLIEQLENVTTIDGAEITVGLALGLFGVLWAISSATNSMVMAIRIAHEVPSPHNWVQGRIFALKLSVVAVVSVAAMIWFVVVLPPVLEDRDVGGSFELLLSIGRWPLVLVVSTVTLALLYRAVVGHRTGRFHFISWGAIVATVIWVICTIGLGVVYSWFGQLESTFGSLGAVAALMGWLYLTALAALIGAEIDGARFDRNGSVVDDIPAD
ncbi:MAG: YihY/virulence factor BrkB family protein [Actinomycetota bacterium]